MNFRWTTVEQAGRLGLTGRVWNRDDGAVEVLAEGESASIARLGEWLGHGPRLARVEEVTRHEVTGAPRYTDFTIGVGDV